MMFFRSISCVIVIILAVSSLPTIDCDSNSNIKNEVGSDGWLARNKELQNAINMLAKQIVARMDLTKLFNSNICPDSMPREMCENSGSSFFVWVKELRKTALINQLEKETAKKLEKRLLHIITSSGENKSDLIALLLNSYGLTSPPVAIPAVNSADEIIEQE